MRRQRRRQQKSQAEAVLLAVKHFLCLLYNCIPKSGRGDIALHLGTNLNPL